MTSYVFRKIILHNDLKKKLVLPEKFVELHGESLLDTVSLKLPWGHEWNVGLLKDHGKFYFDQGWSKFIKHYCLEYGHTVVLKYEESSKFSVSIFDESFCEIKYSSIPAPSYGILEKMRKTKPERSTFKEGKKVGEGTSISYSTSKAFEEAMNFSSTKPFFSQVVQSIDQHARYTMRLPNEFVNVHLERKTQMVKLLVGMKSWSLKLLKTKPGYIFSSGWSKFLSENFLRPGDVCIYELIQRKDAILKVFIFKCDAV